MTHLTLFKTGKLRKRARPSYFPRFSNVLRAHHKGMHRSITAQDLPEMLLAHAMQEQLQHALEIQRNRGDSIGEIPVVEGVLDENSLVAFLARHCKIPHLSLLN